MAPVVSHTQAWWDDMRSRMARFHNQRSRSAGSNVYPHLNSTSMGTAPNPRPQGPASARLYEAPQNVVDLAKEFLASVFEDQEADVADRLDALALTRKFEAKRIMPQTVHLTRQSEVDRREAWREYEIWQRQREIVLATLDHPPKGWSDDLLSDDYLPPPGDAWPPTGRGPDGKLILFPKKERG